MNEARMNECVVVDAVRAPTGKSGWKGMEKKGQYAEVSAHDLISSVVEALVERVKQKSEKFDPIEIEDIAVGCLSQIGEQAGNLGRIVALAAGLPEEVAGWTIDRYCNAGLQAINSQAQAIISGSGEIMIAAGVEHMTHYPMGSSFQAAEKAGYPIFVSERAKKRPAFIVPMGFAAELIAEKYDLSKEDMDKFGIWSHQKAVREMRNEEEYKKRVVPVVVKKEGEQDQIFDKDETPRAQALDDPEAAYEAVKKLAPRFKENGKVTPANSSGIVDGAAAVMLMSRKKAEQLGLKPMAKIVSMAVAGSDPYIMLLGPIPAMKKAFSRAGLSMEDMNVFEPNEAFVAPVLAFCKEFGMSFDDSRINPSGGAVALGHPIGASGVMYFTEMVHWLVRNNLRYGIQTLCGGGGIGIATIVEHE